MVNARVVLLYIYSMLDLAKIRAQIINMQTLAHLFHAKIVIPYVKHVLVQQIKIV